MSCTGDDRSLESAVHGRAVRPRPLAHPGAAAADPAEPRCLHELFEEAALRWPDAVAVDVPPGNGRPQRTLVTYAELERRAESIAGNLQRLVTGECIVAILLARDSELLYAAQLGVLKAGAAYVCLESSFPDGRLRALLADSGAVALLTDAAGRARVGAAIEEARVLDTRTLALAPQQHPRDVPTWLTPSSLAYVIYTSGTTGMPKGTLIEHRSITNLVVSDRAEFGLGPGDRVAQNSSAVYDSSVEEIWLALAVGATLVVMDDEVVRLGPDVVPWLRRERITVFCPAPTMLRATGCRDPERELPDVRLVYCGGEALTSDLAARWARGRRLENGYGPTECAVTALRTTIRSDGEISVGTPIPGISAWVLDEALQEVADGQTGELCLGGTGLARGYHRRAELTAEKFPVHPVLGRIYRTGDLTHRSSGGAFFFHGRIDAQVKVRGHRVELEEIETQLALCDGVREAACRVQGNAIIAFIVPDRTAVPPGEETLRAALGRVLPPHMVPARIAALATLPRTTGGKLDRAALPSLAITLADDVAPGVPPRNAVEERIAATFGEALGTTRPVSVMHDFFLDLGGDSLSAAVSISLLRDDPTTVALTVRDIYERRTVAGLAACAGERSAAAAGPGGAGVLPGPSAVAAGLEPPLGPPMAAMLFQGVWLLKDVVVVSLLTYALVFHAAPALFSRLGAIATLLFLPTLTVAGFTGYAVVALLYARWLKRRLIGRYRPARVPVWGRLYLEHWVVQRAAALIPWWLLEGTEYQKTALRALGARIGQRVHIHRGVQLHAGAWDLLEIGDDVTLGQSAAVRTTALESRALIIGPVVLGAGCTLGVQAGVAPHSCVEPGAYLTGHSSLPSGGRIPRGARWDGIPAGPAGAAPEAPPVSGHVLSPLHAGNVLLLARLALVTFLAVPAQVLAYAFWLLWGGRADTLASGMAGWLDLRAVIAVSVFAMLLVPPTLLMQAAACRLMGRVASGVVSRWGYGYVRIWLKAGLVDAAGRWLYGTLFWPYWLRLAGARIGRGCEISSLIDTLPEMIDVGARTFCADGIYLAGPRVHRGSVTIAPVTLGSHVFLGNGVHVPGGTDVPEETLIGIETVVAGTPLRPHTAWFGHPPFELPRRQIIAADERLTEHPTALRYGTRLTWELLRFTLPVVPAFAVLIYLASVESLAGLGWPPLLLALPLVTAGTALLPVLAALATKWLLLGRVRPGTHPLWSCWNSRWDFFCIVWNVYVAEFSALLQGTPFTAVLLRAAGVRVGRGVVLGGSFAEDLPDPDMLVIEDGATVEGSFQAHTFEDRVLKNDRVVVGRGATVGHQAVLMYGAVIGAGTRVAPHSVVMKYEHLQAGASYEGFPTRPVADTPRAGTAA